MTDSVKEINESLAPDANTLATSVATPSPAQKVQTRTVETQTKNVPKLPPKGQMVKAMPKVGMYFV